MKPTDLTGLIKGLMVVIGIAMALGRLDELKRWAIKEAFPRSLPYSVACGGFGGGIRTPGTL